ncbi:MAG: SCO family protein [Salinivirgaceae bacterium]
MRLLKFLLLPILLLTISLAYGQFAGSKQPEVGLFEHLDDTIPLNLTFYNEKGELVKLGNFINKPTVLSFVYFDCPGLCNPLLDGLNNVVGKTYMVLGVQYDVVTISFNPGDSPAKAVDKKRNFSTNVNESNSMHWNYLVGDSANVNAILNAVGFKVKKVGVDYLHPSAIMLVSPNGKLTRYLYGTYFLPFDFKMAVSEASQGLSRPTINRVLEYCFSYDPQGQKYKLQITKISATIIIFFALVLFLVLVIKRKKSKQT